MKNQKGFTLIELSIVLVIIGIILGAVLKGQDLINSARAKKVTQWEKQWETAVWAYMDRMGRLPGDSVTPNDGIIGNDASENAMTDISGASFVNTPQPTITIGSSSFRILVGNDGGHTGTGTKNVIIICNGTSTACDSTNAVAFTSDQLAILESIDTAIDNTANPGTGNVLGIPKTALPGVGAYTMAGAADATTDNTWSTATDYALGIWFDKASGQ